MNDQRQLGTRQEALRPGGHGPDDPAATERLAEARNHLDRIYAAADSILDSIRLAGSERFLEQVRQSGGQ